MAIRKTDKQRSSQKICRTRPGFKGAPGKNSRHLPKAKRKIIVPWLKIQDFLSALVIPAGLLFFIACMCFLMTYCYRFFTATDYFSLKTIEIQGNIRLSVRKILELTHLTDETNTLALSINVVEEALTRSPWVEKVSVKRMLPGKLTIAIREKQPTFWVLHEGSLHYADTFGRLIARVTPGKFASLPTLEVEAGAEEATAELPDFIRSLQESALPLDMASVSLVRLSVARGVEVHINESRLKIAIDIENWMPNIKRLSLALADLGRRGELARVREIKAQGNNVWVKKTPATPIGG